MQKYFEYSSFIHRFVNFLFKFGKVDLCNSFAYISLQSLNKDHLIANPKSTAHIFLRKPT